MVNKSFDSTGQANILVVDDIMANIEVLSGMLKQKGYKVRPVLDGKTALQAVKNNLPDLILLDIMMPEMDGYQVCEILKRDQDTRDIPVIFISALSDPFDKVRAFSVGGVDYITKPFQLEEVQARVKTHIRLRTAQIELEEYNQHLEELIQEQIGELLDSQMATILALAKLAEYRDEDSGKHIERIQDLCKMLSIRLSKRLQNTSILTSIFTENIYNASILHDIGKVSTPDHILLKPGKLTFEEFEIMKKHAPIGAQLLETVKERYPKNHFINMGIDIARSHHEKWDGSGYPDGLKGEAIPLAARIVTVADVYDALRSKRPYKSEFTHEESYDIIVKGKGTHFDPDIVETFKDIHLELRSVRDQI